MEDKILSAEIERLYPILLDRSRGLVRSKSEGLELLHTVIAHLMDTEERRDRLHDLIVRGGLEYYMNRCIYLSAYSKTSEYQRKKLRAIEMAEHTEAKISIQSYDRQMGIMMQMATGERLDGLISQLPEFDAELLRLWMLPGFNYDQASEACGIDKKVLTQSVFYSLKNSERYVHHPNSKARSSAGST